MDIWAIALLAVASLLSGLVQSSLGSGYGIVFLALAGPFMEAFEVSIIAALSAMVLNASIVWRMRSHVHFSGLWHISIATVVAVPLGVRFLQHGDESVFQLLIGLIIVFTLLQGRIAGLSKYRWHRVYAGLPVGVLSGVLAGAYGTGGPPAVAFVYSWRLPRLATVATIQYLLLVGAVPRTVVLFQQGLLQSRLLPAAMCMVMCMIGSLIGMRILDKMPERLFRQLLNAFLAIVAVWYLSRWAF